MMDTGTELFALLLLGFLCGFALLFALVLLCVFLGFAVLLLCFLLGFALLFALLLLCFLLGFALPLLLLCFLLLPAAPTAIMERYWPCGQSRPRPPPPTHFVPEAIGIWAF